MTWGPQGPAQAQPQARAHVLLASADFSARLTYYPPNMVQPRHAHAAAQFSFLLAGELSERIGRRETEVLHRAAAAKMCGTEHAVEFGPHGATILSFDLADDRDFSAIEPAQWNYVGNELGPLVQAALASSGDTLALRSVLDDLVASRAADCPGTLRAGWLDRARDQLRAAPAASRLDALAREAGVHRVHLSRSFTAAFGVPPSLYRLRCMAAQALVAIVCGRQPLAEAAIEAGFADQSHFTRTLRSQTGLTPDQLRRCFDVTNVQDQGRVGQIAEALLRSR